MFISLLFLGCILQLGRGPTRTIVTNKESENDFIDFIKTSESIDNNVGDPGQSDQLSRDPTVSSCHPAVSSSSLSHPRRHPQRQSYCRPWCWFRVSSFFMKSQVTSSIFLALTSGTLEVRQCLDNVSDLSSSGSSPEASRSPSIRGHGYDPHRLA